MIFANVKNDIQDEFKMPLARHYAINCKNMLF